MQASWLLSVVLWPTHEAGKAAPKFRALLAPTQEDIHRVVQRVHKRAMALLERRGLIDELVAWVPFLWASRAAGTQRNFPRGRFSSLFWFWQWPLQDNFLATCRALLFVVTHSLVFSGRV